MATIICWQLEGTFSDVLWPQSSAGSWKALSAMQVQEGRSKALPNGTSTAMKIQAAAATTRNRTKAIPKLVPFLAPLGRNCIQVSITYKEWTLLWGPGMPLWLTWQSQARVCDCECDSPSKARAWCATVTHLAKPGPGVPLWLTQQSHIIKSNFWYGIRWSLLFLRALSCYIRYTVTFHQAWNWCCLTSCI